MNFHVYIAGVFFQDDRITVFVRLYLYGYRLSKQASSHLKKYSKAGKKQNGRSFCRNSRFLIAISFLFEKRSPKGTRSAGTASSSPSLHQILERASLISVFLLLDPSSFNTRNALLRRSDPLKTGTNNKHSPLTKGSSTDQ